MVHRINEMSHIAPCQLHPFGLSGTARSKDDVSKRIIANLCNLHNILALISLMRKIACRYYANSFNWCSIICISRKDGVGMNAIYHLSMTLFGLTWIQRNVCLTAKPQSQDGGISANIICCIQADEIIICTIYLTIYLLHIVKELPIAILFVCNAKCYCV